jgi:hypothetical protein
MNSHTLADRVFWNCIRGTAAIPFAARARQPMPHIEEVS